MEELNMTQEWDKTFAKSDKVDHQKVSFPTQYGFTLAADVYKPKGAEGELAAIVVCGPYGAVKEQSSGLYAQTLAERGFVTVAFDPSFTGESSGEPRNQTSPDINVEDYSAAIDYLVSRDDVDEDKIGIVGICGWGGLALAAASIDTRIKATVGSTTANLNADSGGEGRSQMLKLINAQRSVVAKGGEATMLTVVPAEVDESTPLPMRDYHDYYRNPERGYHPRSINSGQPVSATAGRAFTTFSMFDHIADIETPVLLVHGEKAFTYPVAQDLIGRMRGDNKRLLTVPGASHTDLYDGGGKDAIPFDDIATFFNESL